MYNKHILKPQDEKNINFIKNIIENKEKLIFYPKLNNESIDFKYFDNEKITELKQKKIAESKKHNESIINQIEKIYNDLTMK